MTVNVDIYNMQKWALLLENLIFVLTISQSSKNGSACFFAKVEDKTNNEKKDKQKNLNYNKKLKGKKLKKKAENQKA